jgi:hypothetical protein
MHEKLLSLAVLPMPGKILGLDLMPYSLGFELRLFREDSPFMTLEWDEFNKLSFQDQCQAVLRGVMVCCKEEPADFDKWAKRNRPKNNKILALAVADFRNYLADGRLQFRSTLPSSDDSAVRYIGEPEILRLYRFICANLPREEIKIWGETAWDVPYSFAKMLSQGHAESNGCLEIYNIQKKTHDDYHQSLEKAREAWYSAKTDPERLVALEKNPQIRELLDLQAILTEFDLRMNPAPKNPQPADKCPA